VGIECVGAEVGSNDIFYARRGREDGVGKVAVVDGEDGGVESFDYGVLVAEEGVEGVRGGVVYCCETDVGWEEGGVG
jgi:hypothetical protein